MASGKKEKGVTSSDRGTIVPADKRKPGDPMNLHLSKADYIAKENKRKEKEAALAKYAKEYDAKKTAPTGTGPDVPKPKRKKEAKK